MILRKLPWKGVLSYLSETMLSDDRSGDLIALIFVLVLTVVAIASLPV